MLTTRAGRLFRLKLSSFWCGLVLVTLLINLPGRAHAEPERGSRDKPILVLDAGGHTADIQGLAFTPDGKMLISSSGDHSIRFWHVATGVLVRLLRLPIYGESAGDGKEALSPDGQLLAVAPDSVRLPAGRPAKP
jgi:WD40 repeat protein